MAHDPTAKELFFKTRLCTFYLKGKCKRGRHCTFAHGDDKVHDLPDFYKTRRCLTLLKTGKCPRGADCSYAHSRADMRHSAVPVAEASGSRVEQPRSAKLSAMRPTTSDLFEDQVEPSAPCLDAEPDDTMMVTQDEIQHAFSTQTSMHKSQTASVATFVPQRDDTLQHARQNVSNAAPLAPSKLSDPSALISSLLGRIGVRQEMVNGDPSSASSAALTPLLRAVIAQQRGMEMDSAPDFLPSRSPVTGSSETFPSKYGTSFARNAIHPSDLASSQPDLTGNFSNPCLSAAEVPTARFQTPSPQDTGFPSGDREIEPVLPSGMQIKNRFLGADSSLPEASVFSPLAVRTAPELPVFNPDTMEPP